jgi:uncharacterized protein
VQVIIDTNVLISAALRDRAPEAVILFVVEQPDFEWIVSTDIIQEYKEVLSRKKFGLRQDILQRWFNLLDTVTVLVPVDITVAFPHDQKDAKFLECALVSGANYFITGDLDFTEAQRLVTTTILSVSLFKKLVCDPLQRPVV